MTLKKESLKVIVAAALSASLLAGCGGSPQKSESKADTAKEKDVFLEDTNENDTPEEPVLIRLWGGVPPETGPQAVCDNFNELYKDKGIQVEYERFVNDETGNLKLETNLLSGTGVDLYMTYSSDGLTKRAEGNMALDLTELMEKDDFQLTEYFGSMAESYYVDGAPYSIPTKLDQYGIVLNKTMFEEAGLEIPTEWTYAEFQETAKKLTHGEGQDKVYGMFWNTQSDLTGIFNYLASQTLGGDYFYKSETESGFDDPTMKKTAELVYNMMNVDKTSPTHTDSVTQKLSQESMFLTGRSAMTIGPWMVRSIKNLNDYPHDFETAFAPYPIVEEGKRNFTQGGFGDHLCINPKSENVDAAWEFAKWYATEGMLPVVEGGRVPSSNTYDVEKVTEAFLKGAEDHMDLESTKNVLITPVDNYAVPSITNHLAEVKKIATEEMEAIFIDTKTVDEGMESAKTRCDEILKQ